ncbi:alpha/beta fold hydrolase [Massilia pseudoviolaceinigra]|uniref:alpha/beta fold hydrolase n=1 Tax=Massilia pseudoviolaceinigra TaxID=3057165 RepID=UPI0027968AA5|nr:alpha/beta hydrolase [Massilia sp. CCM 9206]MDQ1920784.1 alpha/beta hydrolase [Massilia sp. CCM 9206]
MEQTLTVNGIAMHVVTDGEGPAVLLLHGFPDTHAVWRLQIDALAAAGYRVIAPDLRGYGKTEAPASEDGYAMEVLRADMVALLDALGVERALLIGHDWGSVVGWNLCMYAPERVERFVALSVGHPAAYTEGGPLQLLKGYYVLVFQLRGIAESLIKAFDWHALRGMASTPRQFEEWRAHLDRPGRLTADLNYYRANLKMFNASTWPTVNLPVLGIWSAGDVALTEAQMRGSEKYVGDSFQYERIEKAGHWLQLEAAPQVNASILKFLKAEQAVAQIASRETIP